LFSFLCTYTKYLAINEPGFGVVASEGWEFVLAAGRNLEVLIKVDLRWNQK
jgi:hypothetical protein